MVWPHHCCSLLTGVRIFAADDRSAQQSRGFVQSLTSFQIRSVQTDEIKAYEKNSAKGP